MADSESIVATLLSIVSILIALLIPLPIKEEYRLFIITTIIFIFLISIISKYNSRIERLDKEIIELNKRFKTMEELNDVRLDIRELKRRLFENE